MTLKEMLVRHEGLMLKPYKDSVGKLTIGVGRNLDDVGLSEQEALYLLKNDIDKAIDHAKAFPWYEELNDARKMAVVDMIFNMGVAGFSKFKKTIKHISRGEYDAAGVEMLDSKWAKQVGSRAIRVSELMRSGIVRD